MYAGIPFLQVHAVEKREKSVDGKGKKILSVGVNSLWLIKTILFAWRTTLDVYKLYSF